MKCVKCRAAVRRVDKFCSYCGAAIAQLEEEPAPAPTPPPPPPAPVPFELPEPSSRTGREDLLGAARTIFGAERELAAAPGLGTLQGFALWERNEPRPHVLALTLGFSEQGTALYAYEESGRGFELCCRFEGSSLPDWLMRGLDTLLEHTFSIRDGDTLRVAGVPCSVHQVTGLERVETVNGPLRVLELLGPGGELITSADQDPLPPMPPDGPGGRTEVVWDFGDSVLSLCDQVVTHADAVTRFDTRREAEEAFRKEALAHPLTRTPARRSLRARPPRGAGLEATAENPALEAQMHQERDSRRHAQVYADWLQERGDPRGELASWSLTGKEDALRFFWQHDAETVLGEHAAELGSAISGLEWTHGFLDGLLLAQPRGGGMRAPLELSAFIARVLALPVARFLRRLRLGYPGETDCTASLRAVASTRQAAWLRALSVNTATPDDTELSWMSFGDFSPLWAALPSLEQLHLRGGGGGVLGKIEHASLRRFIRETGGLSAEELRAITLASWPRLEHLELWTGRAEYGAEATVELLEPMFAGRTLPSLHSLGLVNCEIVHECLAPLARSALLPRLKRLDLSRGVLQAQDVAELLRLAPKFTHLEVIDLSRNQLDERSVVALAERFPNGRFDHQREHQEGERYTAVGE